MAEEKPLLFVRRASGLTRAISSWSVIFWGLGVSFLPWHYQLMTLIPTWFPGVNLPFIYFVGGLLVFIEVTSMALIYVALPRSGSIYVPLSRGVSPMLGMLEATRSYITNPFQRGVTAFFAAGQLASLFVIVGQLTKDAGIKAIGGSLSANVWNLVVLAIFFNFVGWIINLLGPRVMSKWVFFWGLGSVVSILIVNFVFASTSPDALRSRWDGTFGSGAYDEVTRVATTGGFTPTALNWGATVSALLLPVSNTWPYTVMPVVGEVEKPRRNIPLSMMGSAGILLLINTFSAFNFTSRYGDFASMYSFVVGNPTLSGQFKINLVMPVDLSAYGSVLASYSTPLTGIVGFAPQWGNFSDVVVNENYTSRPLYAMAMDRMAPTIFARVHPRFHSPYVGSTYWFLATIPTSLLSGAYVGTVAAVVFGITFTYAFARMMQHWSEIELPFSRPEIYKGGLKIEVGGIPLMSILGTFTTAMFLYLLATNQPNTVPAALFIGFIYGLGGVTYFYYAKKNLSRGIPPSKIYGELPPE